MYNNLFTDAIGISFTGKLKFKKYVCFQKFYLYLLVSQLSINHVASVKRTLWASSLLQINLLAFNVWFLLKKIGKRHSNLSQYF